MKRLIVLTSLVVMFILAGGAGAEGIRMACAEGTQGSGALYQICMPDGEWDGTLVLYAHGYVAPDQPLALPSEGADFATFATFANAAGAAFATTSYSKNGLAVREGIADILDLIDIFTAENGTPTTTYLIGFSEGSLITTLAIEENREKFSAGFALCGPIGSFGAQSDYFSDGRVLFDYFFPGVMPGTAVEIPADLQANWETFSTETVVPFLADPTNAETIAEYVAVAGIPFDESDLSTMAQSILTVLWFNVFSTNDGIDGLGASPYDNRDTVYAGSSDDEALNTGVARFAGDAAVLAAIEANYTPTGMLAVPLVTMHTTADPTVPYFHAPMYADLVSANGNDALYLHIPVERYGHCNFTQLEVLGGFNQMVTLANANVEPTAITLRSHAVDSSSLWVGWVGLMVIPSVAMTGYTISVISASKRFVSQRSA